MYFVCMKYSGISVFYSFCLKIIAGRFLCKFYNLLISQSMSDAHKCLCHIMRDVTRAETRNFFAVNVTTHTCKDKQLLYIYKST